MKPKPRIIQTVVEFLGINALVDSLGRDELVKLVNLKSSKGNTLAHRLTRHVSGIDLNEISPYILDWDVINSKDLAPIENAMQAQNMDLVMFLLQRGAQFRNIGDFPLQSFLSYVISFYGNHPEQLEPIEDNLITKLVTYYGVSLSSYDSNGESPLGVAIRTVNTKIIDLIVELGADVQWPCSCNMKPIPFICSAVNDIDQFTLLMDCLLKHGTDINAQSTHFYDNGAPYKISSIVLLMDKPLPEPFIKYMIDHGAALNYVDPNGWTLLHCYIQKVSYQEELIRLLQQHLPACHIEDEGGERYLTFDWTWLTPQLSEEILRDFYCNMSI